MHRSMKTSTLFAALSAAAMTLCTAAAAAQTVQAAPQAAVCEAVGTGVRVPVDVPSMEAVLLRMPAPGAEGETPA